MSVETAKLPKSAKSATSLSIKSAALTTWETGDRGHEKGDRRGEKDNRREEETGYGRQEMVDMRQETEDGGQEMGDSIQETRDGRSETGDARRFSNIKSKKISALKKSGFRSQSLPEPGYLAGAGTFGPPPVPAPA